MLHFPGENEEVRDGWRKKAENRWERKRKTGEGDLQGISEVRKG